MTVTHEELIAFVREQIRPLSARSSRLFSALLTVLEGPPQEDRNRADALKLLTLLAMPCEGTDSHSWRKCKRCTAMHGLENRFSLTMRLLQTAIAALSSSPASVATGAGTDVTDWSIAPSTPPTKTVMLRRPAPVPLPDAAPSPTKNEFGDYVCEHGTAMDVHCCACRRRGFFPPDNCDCYDAPLVVVCSRSCSNPKRDPEQEHPGICVCGGYITDVPKAEGTR